MIEHVYKHLGGGRSLYYSWFGALHTRIDLVLCHRDEEESEILSSEIAEELARIERMADRFDLGSELSRINESASHKCHSLSPELFYIIRDALAWGERTQGYFDITIQSENYQPGLFREVECDERSLSISFLRPGIVLDLNGYIKGYALDKCVAMVKEKGVTDALINFGNSSVAALGNHPNGLGWPINVSEGSLHIPPLRDVFLTTSGFGEKNRFPIINPMTGERKETPGIVSVITSSGVSGETLSTALYASPPDDKAWVDSLPECLNIYN